jgi:hypothetical protein
MENFTNLEETLGIEAKKVFNLFWPVTYLLACEIIVLLILWDLNLLFP